MSKTYEGLLTAIGEDISPPDDALPSLREILATHIPPAVALDFWRTMAGRLGAHDAVEWRLIFRDLQQRYRPLEPWGNGQ